MALDVKSVWAGALTDSSVRIVADTAPPTNGSVLVADNEAMTGAATFGPVTATGEGILAFTVTGLDADTRYWYVVDAGGLNVSYKGTFRTHPGPVGEVASYIFGAAGDAGLTGAGDASHITTAVSNNPVFDTMAAQSRAEEWVWFSHLGDLHYRNIAVNTPALFRAAYDDNFNYNLGFNPGARQGTFLRNQAITYVWDDHDFGANNSNRTSASNPAVNQVYRECVPHYPLAAPTTGIYQAWQVGRVLYIASDVRSFRDPNSNAQAPTKTMLGTAQKAWMENLLSTSDAEALVWQSPSRWLASDSGTGDTWNSFLHERAEMIQMFGDTGWLDRMIQLTADQHNLSICSGPGNRHGGFPIFMFAGMDSDYGSLDALYDLGASAGRRQYGTVRVQDDGHTIALTGTGYIDGALWQAHTAYFDVGSRVFALNYTAEHISPPFEPTKDDQRIRNRITAKRVDGGEATYALEEGRKSVLDPPDGVGLYDEDVTVNVARDEQLPDQAAWRVHLGTVDKSRYPTVNIDLGKNPDLADELTGLYLGDRATIDNLPEWMRPDQVELMVEGGKETYALERWGMELNASPGSSYTVAQLPSPQVVASGDAEVNLTGWFGFNCSLSRVALPAPAPFPGDWSVLVTPNGSATVSANCPSGAARSVIPGEDYIASAWVYSPSGWANMKAAADWADASGAYLTTTGTGSVTAVPAGQWTLLTQTLTAPAGADRGNARSYASGSPTAGDVWYTTRVRLQESRATGYSAGPNRPNRLDTSGTRLVSAVASGATALVVHTSPDGIFERVPWIISTGPAAAPNLHPTHFPFDVRLGGEVVRVTACAPAAWDSFTRTTSNGWGTANSGQVWAATGGSAGDYLTQGSEAAHSLGSVNASRWSTITAPGPDVDFRAEFATFALAAGGSQYVHLTARWLDVNNSYLARLAFTTSQQVQLTLQKRVAGAQTDLTTVTLPKAHTAFGFFHLRFQVEGSALRAKAWPRGVTEPGRWLVTATDTALTAAGSIGVRSILDATNTNTPPLTVAIDNFEITTPQQMTVTRSVNTVEKAQAAGAPVALAQPAPVPL
ncbi:alkaline phosphatase D family protein [Streptomyces phaeochromogenes]